MAFLLLAGCNQATVTPTATLLPDITAVLLSEPAVTPRQLPTLYPSATPMPTATAVATRPPLPTTVPPTPVAFDQVVVEIHYRLPALGLDRRLQGDVSGRLTMEDRATGLSLTRENQNRILLEMQQGLGQLTLAELPDDCENCVWIDYDLPLSGIAGSGWLEDVTLLASLDNFTAIHLGPHVPPGSWLALRRSATSYWVAHTVAVTSDGRTWKWLATEGRIAEPVLLGVEAARLEAAVQGLTDLPLADTYSATCEDAARETIFIGGDDEVGTIRIVCPAHSLPAHMVPLYLELQALLGDVVAGAEPPARPFSLTTLLYYQSADDERLVISYANQVEVESGGEIYSGTLSASQVISLTTGLETSARLTLAVDDVLAAGPGANGLIVRGSSGVSGVTWRGAPPEEVADFVLALELLMAQLVPRAMETPAPATTGALATTNTPAPGGIATPVPGVTATVTP